MLHKDDLVQAEARIKEASAAHLANIEHRLGQLIATTYEALKYTINHKTEKLMSVLDDYITAAQAHYAEIADDLSVIKAQGAATQQQIAVLQAQLASAGLTQAQTDALTALSASVSTLTDQADALAGKQPPAPPVDTSQTPASPPSEPPAAA